MCKGRAFAMRELIIYTAVIITMWEMQPAGGRGEWPTLKTSKQAATKHPTGKCRVWIKRRELPMEDA